MSARAAQRAGGVRVGIDFDNTLVCYDELFARLARERGLLEGGRGGCGDGAPGLGAAGAPATKRSVRDRLRAAGREAAWTELQALAYGPRIAEALPFPGALAFVEACATRGVEAFIVSHKTRLPFAEPRTDLRAAALEWLRRYRVAGAAGAPLESERVFFEATRAAKIERIAALGCTHFVDDLVEFLVEPGLPAGLVRILFEPYADGGGRAAGDGEPEGLLRARSWDEVAHIVFADRAAVGAA